MQLTSQEATHKQAKTVLRIMFGSDENHACEALHNAFDNLGNWTGNGVVSIKCMTRGTRFAYFIRYEMPGS